jgi:hypothetical protein
MGRERKICRRQPPILTAAKQAKAAARRESLAGKVYPDRAAEITALGLGEYRLPAPASQGLGPCLR